MAGSVPNYGGEQANEAFAVIAYPALRDRVAALQAAQREITTQVRALSGGDNGRIPADVFAEFRALNSVVVNASAAAIEYRDKLRACARYARERGQVDEAAQADLEREGLSGLPLLLVGILAAAAVALAVGLYATFRATSGLVAAAEGQRARTAVAIAAWRAAVDRLPPGSRLPDLPHDPDAHPWSDAAVKAVTVLALVAGAAWYFSRRRAA